MPQRSVLVAVPALFAAGAAAEFLAAFDHGVASGDPWHDSIVLWTRATPRLPRDCAYPNAGQPGNCNTTTRTESFRVWWQVAITPAFLPHEIHAEGEAVAALDSDWTVKVIASGLPHSVRLYYRFTLGPAVSPVGTFRLPPPEGTRLEELRYASFTCSNWGWGHFNAYDAALRYRLDFWLHLGDWFYEYDVTRYPPAEKAVRTGLSPEHELVTLEDYRARHRMYRADRNLRRLLEAAPVIAMWDDHDVSNNIWKDGAQNHQPDGPQVPEGPWRERKATAIRAYHEWLPTRSPSNPSDPDYVGSRRWRKFAFGDLATLHTLETRATARTDGEKEASENPKGYMTERVAAVVGLTPPDLLNSSQRRALQQLRAEADAARTDPAAELMGAAQADWLARGVAKSRSLWTLVAQQTVVADCFAPDLVAAAAENAEWAAALANATQPGATYIDHNAMPHNARSTGLPRPVTRSSATFINAAAAEAAARIIGYFDSWCGYVAPRERLLDALRPKHGTVVIYSGDSHSNWAVTHRGSEKGELVATEYGVTSVTSPDYEDGDWAQYLPHAMVERGLSLSNNRSSRGASRYDGGEVHYSSAGVRGFLLFHLTREQHRGEFMRVSTVGAPEYALTCVHAFVHHRGDAEGSPSGLARVPCSPVPGELTPRRVIGGGGVERWPVFAMLCLAGASCLAGAALALVSGPYGQHCCGYRLRPFYAPAGAATAEMDPVVAAGSGATGSPRPPRQTPDGAGSGSAAYV
eukprot:TRINITY_DN11060_c0_g1_i2.p1 TRINITY_DN11060_c0_g1~~TRINITY_DN11060_c0_g1_i2.p1  ORF type:complete len:772 (+),score=164.73 TRINITY_DN11060_c0_g1_i2:68-2317(+)